MRKYYFSVSNVIPKVESVCDDLELLEENYRYKTSVSPDFDGMTKEEAIQDLRTRVRKYEEQYETIDDDSGQ
jgi:chaperonin cofactor prefoldin